MPEKHWAVTVYRDGDEILTISDLHLSGRDLSPEDQDVIRMAARNLLGFVGEVASPADQE